MVSAKRTPFRIYRRGEIWHCYISAQIGGRRIIVRESSGTTERDAALDYCIRRLAELQTAPDITHEITLDAAAARWMIEVGQYQREKGRDYLLNRLLLEMGGDMLLSEISKNNIARFIEICREQKRGPATINRYLAALSAIISRARDYWDFNVPRFKISKFKQKEPVENLRHFTLNEAENIANAAAPYLRPIIWTGLYTGLRLGDILFLTWAQVDFENMQIIYNGKPGKNQSVPMVSKLANILRELPRGGELVFTKNGRPVSRMGRP